MSKQWQGANLTDKVGNKRARARLKVDSDHIKELAKVLEECDSEPCGQWPSMYHKMATAVIEWARSKANATS